MENEIKAYSKWQIFDNFWLKIIALLSMTADHLGLLLVENVIALDSPLYIFLRAFGRLALPLFAFMIAEGVKHTKHFGKYILRLEIMATIIAIAIEFIYRVLEEGVANPNSLAACGNIFIDLLLGAVAGYCLLNKKWQIKLLSLLPLAYGVLATVVRVIETNENGYIAWFPYLIRPQYWFFGIVLVIGFILIIPLKNRVLETIANKVSLDKEFYKGTSLDRTLENILNAFIVVVMSLALYVLTVYYPNFLSINVQTYALLSAVIILLYNGKRGYSKKWFQYGCYLYYPLHIGILALIFYLLGLY